MFRSDGRSLVRIPLRGGSVESIGQTPAVSRGAFWAPDDAIVVGTSAGLLRIDAAGGDFTPLTTLEDDGFHAWPAPVANNTAVVFVHLTEDPVGELLVLDRRTGTVRRLAFEGPIHYMLKAAICSTRPKTSASKP